MSNVCIIGGGAAGMVAAIASSNSENSVTLFEKNKILGKKLLITGKGRCNLTNKCDLNTFLDNIVTNKKFLYSAFSTFSSEDAMDFFETLGVPLKVERGMRVFPESDKSSDIVSALHGKLKSLNVKIINKKVIALACKNYEIFGVILDDEEFVPFDKIIVCTGGISYSTTGSTGDGHRFARELLHNVTKLVPSLVPLVIYENFCSTMMGLSLKNVALTLYNCEKLVYSDFGEMLFTHFGVSGPLILSASAHINLEKNNKYYIYIDLKPALSEKKLDARILRDFEDNKNKEIVNVLPKLLPCSMANVMLNICEIPPTTMVNSITKLQRETLIKNIKAFKLSVKDFRPIEEAIITRGGVSVKDIDPKTMQSKITKGLYFAGEVLDLDGYTGGFNLQIAFSTGFLAGSN